MGPKYSANGVRIFVSSASSGLGGLTIRRWWFGGVGRVLFKTSDFLLQLHNVSLKQCNLLHQILNNRVLIYHNSLYNRELCNYKSFMRSRLCLGNVYFG